MELLIYLLKVNLVFVSLWATHRLLMRRRLLDHRWERGWWLLAPLLAFGLPLLRLPQVVPVADVLWGPELALPTVPVEGTAAREMVRVSGSWLFWLLAIQVSGMGIALLWTLLRYQRAWRLAGQGGEACSFFGRVALPNSIAGEDRVAMEAHERAHVHAGHSFDVLYYELLRALSWWNPTWTAARNSIQAAHEWAADEAASQHHSDYPRLLVARALGVPSSSLVHSFTSIDIKTRIAMLNNEEQAKKSGKRYLALLPVLGICALVACSKASDPGASAAGQLSATEKQATSEEVQLADVDVQPEFPGGMEAMYAYIGKELKMPEEPLPADLNSAKVYIQFTVAKSGAVENVEVKRGVRADLDRAAVEAIERMPNWSPGQKDGVPVAVRFIMPVSYTAAVAK